MTEADGEEGGRGGMTRMKGEGGRRRRWGEEGGRKSRFARGRSGLARSCAAGADALSSAERHRDSRARWQHYDARASSYRARGARPRTDCYVRVLFFRIRTAVRILKTWTRTHVRVLENKTQT